MNKKKTFISTIICSFLTVIMISLCFIFPCVEYKAEARVNAKGARPSYTKTLEKNNRQISKNNKFIKELKEDKKKDDIKSASGNVSNIAVGLINYIKDGAKGEDPNITGLICDIGSNAIVAVAACLGFGGVAESALAIIDSLIPGDQPMSEVEVLTDKMDQRFDEMSNQIDDVYEELQALSNNVNESADRVIDELSEKLDNLDAKQYVRTFMTRGEGNFSYRQLKEYLYDENTALSYLNNITKAKRNGATTEEIIDDWDTLYNSLMSKDSQYYTMLFEYVLEEESGFAKSIVQNYYDAVSARSDLLDDSTAEYEAFEFASDIFSTSHFLFNILESCLYIQEYKIREESLITGRDEDAVRYYFNDITKEYNTLERIGELRADIKNKKKQLEKQMALDMAYVYGMADSYIVENKNGSFYEVSNTDPETFGSVAIGQTIYLNQVPQFVIDSFILDANDFSFSVDNCLDENKAIGVFEITENMLQAKATAYYLDKKLYSIDFLVDNKIGFSGGSGVVEDPYIITNKEQFALVRNGLDKHYILGDDIDYNGMEIAPIGYDKSEDKVREFTGSFDGNGYTISNIKITGVDSVGLFAVLGENASVSNLKLSNATVTSDYKLDGKGAATEVSYFNAGVIAGENKGVITNCFIDLSNVTVNRRNETPDRKIYVYTGGVVGYNLGYVSCCLVNNIKIDVDSYHYYKAQQDANNEHNAHVGGICGYTYGNIENCIIEGSETGIDVYVISESSPKKKEMYGRVKSYVGGIVGQDENLHRVTNVYSSLNNQVHAAYKVDNTAGAESEKHCKVLSGKYAPDNDNKFENKTSKDSIYESFITEFNVKHEAIVSFASAEDNVYYSGENQFRATKVINQGTKDEKIVDTIVLTVDGKVVSSDNYSLIEVFGFDTINESFLPQINAIKLLFVVNMDGKSFVVVADTNILVQGKILNTLVVSGIKYTGYSLNEKVDILGKVANLMYADGQLEVIRISESNINDFALVADTSSYGIHNASITYKNTYVSYDFNVMVNCPHEETHKDHDANKEYFVKTSTQATTCYQPGFDVYACTECGFGYETNYQPKLNVHNTVIDGATDATCTQKGNTGKVYCKDCGLVFYENMETPKIPHSYKNTNNESGHVCDECGDVEQHYYTYVETVDGLSALCVDCGYEHTDSNIKTEYYENQPMVIVSDAYALKGGDVVTVYVQLVNNPGVYGASFGVRYNASLTPAKAPQDGNVLKSSVVQQTKKIENGYNFSWGNGTIKTESGNLVKLEFAIPQGAMTGDSYEVAVVYDFESVNSGLVEHGFVVDVYKDPQKYVTKSGTIYIVDHLPGDVNDDKVVDIADALLLAKAQTDPSIITPDILKWGDLNLSKKIDGGDITLLLQYLTGGYGNNILNHEYEIVLNTNGYDCDIKNLVVDIYGENNTYAKAGLKDLSRDGYKFDGWYDSLFGRFDNNGNLVEPKKINYTDAVKFDSAQKKQTLYAHWILNNIKFADSNNILTPIEEVNYSTLNRNISLDAFKIDGNILTFNTYSEKFELKLYNNVDADEEIASVEYVLDYWYNIDNESEQYKAGDFIDLANMHFGEITLAPKWNVAVSQIPNIEKYGYCFNNKWYTKKSKNDFEHEDRVNLDNLSVEESLRFRNQSGNYILFAELEPIVYTIRFDPNVPTGVNVSGEMTPETNHTIKELTALCPNKFVREGYTFNKWTTKKDGSGVSYVNGEPIGYIDGMRQGGEIVLYAQWSANTYTITFDPQGGIGCPSSMQVTYGKSYELPNKNTVTRSGYTLSKWVCEALENNVMGDGVSGVDGTWIYSSNLQVKAIWSANTYKITFDANGGSVKESSRNVVFNSQYGTLPVPTRSEYTFKGWFTERVDEKNMPSVTETKATTEHTVASNITLYANWVRTYQFIHYSVDTGHRDQTITDSDKYWETVKFGSIRLEKLEKYKYTKVTFTISMDVCEKDDGYQQFWIHKGENGGEIAYVQFEHGGDGRKKDWERHTFSFTFNISDLMTDYNVGSGLIFRIHYGAHGNSGDDWKLGYTQFYVSFS